MDIYSPIYLYIKRHKVTGLKYFGKTTKTNIQSYRGSGKYWQRHLKKYGNITETIWISQPFYDKEVLTEFALFFSEIFNIVESDEWANLINENGLDGAPKGVKVKGLKGKKNPMFGKKAELNHFYGKKHSEETKKIISQKNSGKNNGNYGAKAFTQSTYQKLRQPKKNKQNYKGTPGKITCIDKFGKSVQIDTDLYRKQKLSNKSVSDWDYVNTNSKEAKKRKLLSSL